MKQAVAYIRISREDENIENQRLAIIEWAKKNNFEIVAFFIDKEVSGAIPPREREGYRSMLKFCKDNNIKNIIFYDISRLARDIREGLNEILRLEEEGFAVYTTDNLFELLNQIEYKSLRKGMLSLLLTFAEFYREDIIRRTKEGLKRAKAEGKRLGRPLKLNDEQILLLKKLVKEGYSYRKIAKILNASVSTISRYAKKLNIRSKYSLLFEKIQKKK